MAKKKSKKSGSRRRRRVSGVGSMGGAFTPILGAIAGAAAGKMLTKAIGSKIDPKILAGGQLLLAAMFIPKMIKGALGGGVAAGLGASAGLTLLTELKVLSGVSNFYNVPTINGTPRVPRIAGSARQTLAGVDNVTTQSADVRQFRPQNHNFATRSNQMNVLSGMDSEFDEAAYGL